MPAVEIRGGARVEIPNLAEIEATVGGSVGQQITAWQDSTAALRDAEARAVKWLRLPQGLTGKPASSAITLGITKGQTPVGPELGYAWAIVRLVVTGLTSGGSPDIVNLYLNDNFNGPIQWQFNGNNFGYTFDPPMIITGGETLGLQNSGSITSTSQITLSGEVWQVPQEMLYKMIGAA